MSKVRIPFAPFAFAMKYQSTVLQFRKSCLTTMVFTSVLFGAAAATHAQQHKKGEAGNTPGPTSPLSADDARRPTADPTATGLSERERLLLDRIEKLERRLSELEHMPADSVSQADAQDFFRDTTINFTIDGYYSYNFNRPVGRVNLLRAYNVSHNSFSLNQAAIIVEHAPRVEEGRRFGLRLDLQYGQATETVQGNANNELRPQAYRPIWQAYATYVAPVGDGLTVDFGKFAGSLGYETNYTKDNYNYSRAYFFNFLPFYHFGFRARYRVNDKLAVMYHLMNGAQQSEDFNRFKSQHVALILTPEKRVSWQINYYVGREQRDVVANLNPTFPTLPTQPGIPIGDIRPSPRGRFHVLDTYATWNVTDELTLAAEADYVINRVEDFSPPTRVTGGTLYARYQFTPVFALAGRAEYLSDRGGIFSGLTQALKETTITADFKVANGFLLRGEWRRDWSNQPFFLTETPGFVKKDQHTATVGLIWWFGQKQGSW